MILKIIYEILLKQLHTYYEERIIYLGGVSKQP